MNNSVPCWSAFLFEPRRTGLKRLARYCSIQPFHKSFSQNIDYQDDCSAPVPYKSKAVLKKMKGHVVVVSVLALLGPLVVGGFSAHHCHRNTKPTRANAVSSRDQWKHGEKPASALGQSVFDDVVESSDDGGLIGFSYGEFARKYPFANNIGIATTKTAAADLIAQVLIAQTPVSEIDYQRSLLFCAFGAIYLGGFQYLYQVNIFKKLFDVDSFTSQPWGDKLRDEEGLKALAAQTALDLTILTLVYLPTFYVFKAGVFSGSLDPSVWTSSGLETYQQNFAKDEFDLIRVWLPADLVCFSVPLYLRLPVRHIVSFVWTAYLSFARGGH